MIDKAKQANQDAADQLKQAFATVPLSGVGTMAAGPGRMSGPSAAQPMAAQAAPRLNSGETMVFTAGDRPAANAATAGQVQHGRPVDDHDGGVVGHLEPDQLGGDGDKAGAS